MGADDGGCVSSPHTSQQFVGNLVGGLVGPVGDSVGLVGSGVGNVGAGDGGVGTSVGSFAVVFLFFIVLLCYAFKKKHNKRIDRKKA